MQSQPSLLSLEIMVVDGYPDTREIFKELLELSGYQVTTAKDGSEALLRMFEQVVPIVIIDEDLPDFNGPTLSACLKATAVEAWKGARCITIAVRGDALYRVDSAWKHYDHIVSKPLDYEHFDALLAKVFWTSNTIAKSN